MAGQLRFIFTPSSRQYREEPKRWPDCRVIPPEYNAITAPIYETGTLLLLGTGLKSSVGFRKKRRKENLIATDPQLYEMASLLGAVVNFNRPDKYALQ